MPPAPADAARRPASRSALILRALLVASGAMLLASPAARAQVAPPDPPPVFAPHVGGQWGPVLVWPHVPVSVANLPDGRVLTFASNEPNRFPGSQNDEYTHAAVWDPQTGELVDVPHPNHDMFCAALVMLESGEPFVMGGRNQEDSPWTSYYDYHNDRWVQIEDMNRGRWYPTAVYLGNGDIFIAAGVGGGVNPELWSPTSGWKLLTGIDLTDTILQFGERDGSGSWPLLQLAPDGTVFHHGATDRMNVLDPFGGPSGLGTLTDAGPHGRGWFPDEGVSVLYDAGRILVAGGSSSTGDDTAVASAFTIDLGGSARPVAAASMNFPRQFQNEVVLPTGDVAVFGGNTSGAKFTDSFAVKNAEAWDPDTDTWTLWNAQDQARAYHSVAILLPDATVFSAGGGLDGDSCAEPEGPGECGDDHWNAEIFSPPYLFDESGDPATRPAIEDAPGVARVGRTLDVRATPGLDGFSMVRMAATTHTMNTDQRFLRPDVVETAPGSYAVALHDNENVLVPGYWMLFAMQGDVPSVAHVIQIVNDGTPRGRPIAGLRNEQGREVFVAIEAEDPDGQPLQFAATGLPDGLAIDPVTGVIEGTATTSGVYNTVVTAFDGSEAGTVGFPWTIASARSEVGTVRVGQAGRGPWHRVDLRHVYRDPVVVMGPPGTDDPAPVTVRVRDVSPDHFEFQLQEWAYQDGSHGAEDVSYLVVEAGDHLLPGGGAVVAGRVTGIDNENPFVQAFPHGAFLDPPVVLAQVTTDRGTRAVVPRVEDVTTEGFLVRIQGEEALSQNLPIEDLDWIAIEPASVPGLLDADRTGATVDDAPQAVAYAQGFPDWPHLLALPQTRNGGDTAALRHLDPSTSGVSFFIQEEQSDDDETGHANEDVGWLAVDPAVESLGLLPLFNRAPVVADPGDRADARGDAVSLFVAASDEDGDALRFAAAGLPPGLSIHPDTGEISGTLEASGVFDVTVGASDPSGDAGSAGFVWTVAPPFELLAFPTPPRLVGSTVAYSASTSAPGDLRFEWDFGDGSPPEGPGTSPDVSHVFAAPGRYVVTVRVSDLDTGAVDEMQFVQNVFAPPTPQAPTHSRSILYETARDRVWAVNPDNDSLAVIDALSLARVAEVPVCDDPRTLALAGDGRVWVACKDAAAIDVVDPVALTVDTSFALPAGSRPHGLVFAPGGGSAYVALEALGRVLRLDDPTGAVLASRDVGLHVRHLAVTADGARVLATRFVTPPLPGEADGAPQTSVDGSALGGEILSLDATTLAPGPGHVLAASLLPDTEQSARGIPNYLGAPVISPDGAELRVPSKQDNVLRGALRDGFALTFDSTVRAITSRVDLVTGEEDAVARVDHDDASMASAALYDATGSYLFTALEGNRQVAIVDAFTHFELGRVDAGRAPQGLVLSPDGRTLFVDEFMDRTVSVFALGDLLDYEDTALPRLATVDKLSGEALDPAVLRGKQLFYDAADPRLALESYMACASCHNDGGHDGRVWDFTQFGEGQRNTIGLRGHGDHGPLHWSANFDEVQDFEGQIRQFAAGRGLMDDADFAATSDPLGPPKAGLSPDLDALAAYVTSLVDDGASPHRAPDGSLTADALAGRDVFRAEDCGSCHRGAAFTDSALGVPHDVGTLRPSSGPQTALDTPTLRGLWLTAPYLHDGSEATLAGAVTRHAGVSLSGEPLAQLVAYLEQIDDAEVRAPLDPTSGLVGAWGFEEPAGAIALDASGRGHDGTLAGDASRATDGRFGQALETQGDSGRVELGGLDAGPGQLTLMAWINADDFGVRDARILSKSTSAAGQDHVWMLSTIDGPRLRFRLRTDGSTTTLVGNGGTLAAGAWIHAAVTYDGEAMRIYQDGALVGSTPKTGPVEQAPAVAAWIANNPGEPDQVFDGRIDEVKIFSRALSPAEIAAEMAAPVLAPDDTQPPGAPASLQADAIGSDAVELAWAPATDDVAVAGYRVYRDGALVAETAELTYVDGSLAEGTAYVYEVTAVDARGNEGPPAGPAAVTTPAPDVQAPDPPGDVGAAAEGATLVRITWTEAVDDVAVVAYRIYRDGAQIASLPPTARSHLDTGASASTTHAYEVTALDLAGNESDPGATTRVVTTPEAPSGLLGAWGFDEASGATALDASGLARHGTLANGAGRADGFFGRALETDGAAGNVDLGGLDVPGDQLSILVWIRPDDFGTSDARIVSKSTGAAERDHVWMLSTIDGPHLRFRLETGGSTSTLVGDGGALAAGTWTHAAATYDGATMRLYQDGVLVGSRAKSGPIDPDPAVAAWVAANPGRSGQVFDGRIDELKIYGRALDAGEIQAEMAAPIVDPNDVEPPTAPAFLAATPIGSDAVRLDWGAASDDIAVTGYRVRRDGAPIGTTSALSFTDTGLASGTTYSYAVTAFDAKDNEGEAAGPAVATTPAPDVQAPTPPGDLGAVALSPTRVELAWTEAFDDVAVTGYRVHRDGAPMAALGGAARDYVDEDATPDTTHRYALSAFDLAGNESDPLDATRLVTTPPPPADLVAAWGFEEPGGAVAVDASGQGHDGVLEAGASRVAAGFFGQALETDGDAGHVDLGFLDAGPAELTLMAWIHADDFGVRDARILSKSTSAAGQDHVWMLSTIDGPRLRFRLRTDGSTTTLVGSGGTLAAGTWIHAAVTYDGEAMRIYQDGALVGSTPKTGPVEQAPAVAAWIASNPGEPDQVFDGRIDEVKIFRRALSPAEIAAEMATPAVAP